MLPEKVLGAAPLFIELGQVGLDDLQVVLGLSLLVSESVDRVLDGAGGRAAMLLEVVGQPTVDPRQVSDRALHLFEVKQHLDVLLDLGVRALFHQVLDALTVEEEEAADPDRQDAQDGLLRRVADLGRTVGFGRPELKLGREWPLIVGLLAQRGAAQKSVVLPLVVKPNLGGDLDRVADRQGSPDAVGDHAVLLLDVLGHVAVEAPGEGVEEGCLARAVGAEEQRDRFDLVRGQVKRLGALELAEVSQRDRLELHGIISLTAATLSSARCSSLSSSRTCFSVRLTLRPPCHGSSSSRPSHVHELVALLERSQHLKCCLVVLGQLAELVGSFEFTNE